MDFNVQYITKQLGEKQAVIVSIENWLSLQKQLEALQKQTLLYDDISDSMCEAIQMEQSEESSHFILLNKSRQKFSSKIL